MRDNRFRALTIIIAVFIALGMAGYWFFPRILAAMPGRVRYYVPEPVLVAFTTPLPTSLPAPAGHAPELPILELTTPVFASTPTLVAGPVPSLIASEIAVAPIPPATGPPATGTPATTPSAIPLPPYIRLDGVPIIPQKFNNCGPTNLTLVLNYHDIDVDQFDVAAVVRPNYEDRNVSPEELVNFVLNETGLQAGVYRGGDLNLLRQFLAAGYPVIIEKGLIPDETTGWMGHYLTLFGYDDITRHFYARDTFLGPWQGDGLVNYKEIENSWHSFNDTFIIVYLPEQAEEVAELLGPDYLAPPAMWQRAVERAQTATGRDEGDAFAWFNLGTSLVNLARIKEDSTLQEAAAAAFDQSRRLGLPPRMLWYQFEPYEAYLATNRHQDVLELTELILSNQGGRNVEETYFYRALALRAAGEEEAALQAFNRAIQLNPSSPIAALAVSASEAGP
jgi:hypothetical protein